MTSPAALVRDAVATACNAELDALKPGNVHVHADGHGMTVADFRKSAQVTADVLGAPGLSVGKRILRAVEKTMRVVECNTNLGIVLLCAPLAQAAHLGHVGGGLRAGLKRVLAALDVEDARLAYRAIRLANPTGLGFSGRHDVTDKPKVTLLEAMREAQDRDCIAAQYANDFADVFDLGLTRYYDALSRWQRPEWASTAVYLGFLARFPDSHVVRSFGAEAAERVRRKAATLDRQFQECSDPAAMRDRLMEFDAELKAREENPGTSADLTVASLLAAGLTDIDETGAIDETAAS
jgi:triphosphoribosyl-dephospho-CoA synthase